MIRRSFITAIHWLGTRQGMPVLVLGGVVVLHWLWLLLGWSILPAPSLLSDLGFVLFDGVAIWACWGAADAPSIPNAILVAWRTLAFAFVFDFLGNCYWGYSVYVLNTTPTVSLADLAFVLNYLLILVAIICMAPFQQMLRSATFWLDALTIVVGGVIVLWYSVLAPIVAQRPNGLLDAAVVMGYPILNGIALMALLVLLLDRSQVDRRIISLITVYVVLSGGASLFYTGAVLEAQYNSAAVFNGLWSSSFLFLVLAARISPWRLPVARAATATEERQHRQSIVPYFVIGGTYVMLTTLAFVNRSNTLSSLVGAAILIGLIAVARQFLTMRENARLSAEKVRREGQNLYTALVERLPVVVYVQDPSPPYELLYISPKAQQLFGCIPQELLGSIEHGWNRYVVAEDLAEVLELSQHSNTTGVPFALEYRIRNRDGRIIWVREESVLVQDAQGKPQSWQGIVFEITAQRMMQDQLMYQVKHDLLTGLANRGQLLDQLTTLRELPAPIALLFIDLDGFKVVNDTYGHLVGDQVLIEVAQRLREGVRPSDLVVRLSGDEFVVLLNRLHSDMDAPTVAERLCEALCSVFVLEHQRIQVTPSIGIAYSYPPHNTSEVLIAAADAAMYAAKTAGGARYAVSNVVHPAPHTPQ